MNKFTPSGIPANYHNQVEGSQIDHIHRWTNAKRLNNLENGSKLIILRCRRCELMKSTEIYVEYKQGRAIAKRVDRIIESQPNVNEPSYIEWKTAQAQRRNGSACICSNALKVLPKA